MAGPHSKISASSCERWWNCPGSVREVAKCPEQIQSEYAHEGTVAHHICEMSLKENQDPFRYLGLNVQNVIVSPEMIEAVQMYLDVIDADLEQYGLTRKDLQVERKFHLTQIHPDAYGTNDANLPVFLTKVIVYDFKYGSGVAVDAEDNKQGLYYALGAAKEGDYTDIEIVIVQPRAIHREGPVRRWTVTIDDLVAFAKKLRAKVAETQAPDAALNCGPWCKKTFCPALIQCPEARRDMQEASLVVFDGPVATNQPPKPETLTAAQLSRLLEMMPIIDTYLKSVESYALELANRGQEVPGFKLVARRSNRKWVNEEDVKAKFGVLATRTVVETLSPSQLEDVIKKEQKVTGKKAKEIVEPLTFKPDAGNTLVPISDPRDAAKPKLEQTFATEELFQ